MNREAFIPSTQQLGDAMRALCPVHLTRDLFTPPSGTAALITCDGKPEHIMLALYQRTDEIFVRFFGSWTVSSTELLNLLCTTCSGATPTIEKLIIHMPTTERPDFDRAFQLSRLAKVFAGSSEQSEVLSIKLSYPRVT